LEKEFEKCGKGDSDFVELNLVEKRTVPISTLLAEFHIGYKNNPFKVILWNFKYFCTQINNLLI